MINEPFWPDNSFTKSILKHSLGRQFLGKIGPHLVKKKLDGFELLLDLNDKWGVSKYILRHGSYDAEYCFLIENMLKPGAVCLDVGANIGYWSSFLLSRKNTGYVIAIEPARSNLKILKANVELNLKSQKVASAGKTGPEAKAQRIEIHGCAAGAKKAVVPLYLSAENAGDHQLYESNEKRESDLVEVLPVDEIVGARKIDLIKMDIQGFEPFAIQGMTKTIANNPDIIIFTEYWPHGIRKAGGSEKKMLEYFSEQGFICHVVDKPSRELIVIAFTDVDQRLASEEHTDLILSRKQLTMIKIPENVLIN